MFQLCKWWRSSKKSYCNTSPNRCQSKKAWHWGLPHFHLHKMAVRRKQLFNLFNRKTCEKALKSKKKLLSIDKKSLGFQRETNLYINGNLNRYFQYLGFRCRQLKNGNQTGISKSEFNLISSDTNPWFWTLWGAWYPAISSKL